MNSYSRLPNKPDNGERYSQPNSPSWMDKYKGADYGSAAGMGLQDLISQLVNIAKAPVVAGSAAAGAMAGTPAGQNPMGNINEAVTKALGPYQKGVEKALKMSGEAHAAEAIQAGVPPQHIEQEAGINQQLNLNQALANPQPGSPGIASGPQSASPMPNQPIMQKSQGFFDPGAYDPAANTMRMPGGFMNGWGTDRIAKQQQLMANQQKIAGQEPIQPKDYMAANNSLMEKFAAASSTADKATNTKIQSGQALLQDLAGIENMYESTFGKGGGTAEGVWTETMKKLNIAQDAKSYDDYISAQATKLGKFIGEDRFTEQDRAVYKKLFPNGFTDKKNVKLKFAILKDMIGSTLNAQTSGDTSFSFAKRGNAMMKFVSEARAKGFSEQDIMSQLSKGVGA